MSFVSPRCSMFHWGLGEAKLTVSGGASVLRPHSYEAELGCPEEGLPSQKVNFTERLDDKMISIFKSRVRSMPQTTNTFWLRFFANIVYDSLILKFLKLFSACLVTEYKYNITCKTEHFTCLLLIHILLIYVFSNCQESIVSYHGPTPLHNAISF